MQPHGPYKVTIVNRRYASGRHMINSVTIAKNIKRMEHVAAVRYIKAGEELKLVHSHHEALIF
jgi:hypothetical protein